MHTFLVPSFATVRGNNLCFSIIYIRTPFAQKRVRQQKQEQKKALSMRKKTQTHKRNKKKLNRHKIASEILFSFSFALVNCIFIWQQDLFGGRIFFSFSLFFFLLFRRCFFDARFFCFAHFRLIHHKNRKAKNHFCSLL